MTPRIRNPHALAVEPVKAMTALEASLAAGPLDHALMELVRLRVSQINGCAYCIHMHSTDLRKAGDSEMRLYMLNAWRESSLYSDRERAALGWAEALTRVADTGAPDSDYEALKVQFGEAEQVYLTMLIGSINTWNRLQVGMRAAHPASAADRATASQLEAA